MRSPIATIRLERGNVGWFDPLTNIHLTIRKPDAYVFEGMNTTNIRKGIQHKTIILMDGSLEPSINLNEGQTPSGPKVNVMQEVPAMEQPIAEPDALPVEIFEKYEAKEIAINEEVIAEIVEEVIEDEVEVKEEKKKPAKKTTKKKATK